mgnify:FL=1
METKNSTKQDVKYTLQCITKGNNIMKIEYKTLTDVKTDYLALSLIDRGLANTRALKISEGLKNNDWDKITSAICNCDCSNFSLLLEIEPRLIYTAFEKEKCNALKERIEQETNTFYSGGEWLKESTIGDTTF